MGSRIEVGERPDREKALFNRHVKEMESECGMTCFCSLQVRSYGQIGGAGDLKIRCLLKDLAPWLTAVSRTTTSIGVDSVLEEYRGTHRKALKPLHMRRLDGE